ncbi:MULTISPECIES: imm11 family protein [Erwiniaceae]|uniref:imm11 family protein n=1 Tax=Erwiniaceae TaxID=1903409 RepID=UPI0005F80EF0|nr:MULTISPECIES: DUF1629 domain-containing protein [Erwiniaceae]KJV35876.1 hypothetical protein VI01_00060 [Pantoea sp. SM3]MBK0091572.1 hypothetical protein [Erwinia sp. S59]MBK0124832.1 hypothetical protein [Pantoea sp. S61]
MNKSNEIFYVMEYLPDDAGCPHFMDKNWDPELPDYDIFVSPPVESNFAKSYALKAASEKLDGDYLISDNLVSSGFLNLCEKFGVRKISRHADITLLKKKKPEKEYFLFFLVDYIEILDKEKSLFNISHDIESGLPDTPEARGLDKTYYDKIDRFIIKKDVEKHLFFCQELSKPVCSKALKDEFQTLGMKGIEFKIIDEDFKYDPWAGW